MLAKTVVKPMSEADIGTDLLKQLDTKLIQLVAVGAGQVVPLSPADTTRAVRYHLASGGRRIRGRMAIHAGLALGLQKEDALCLAAIVELLHNASLIHDDVQDGDKSRHGQQAVWAKFGLNVAICAGDLMISAAYAALCDFSDSRVIRDLLMLVHERTALAIHGQCADLNTQHIPIHRTEAYEKVVIAKSGALLSLPLELALIASGQRRWAAQARHAAEAFAVAYQVADDLADVPRDRQQGSLNIVLMLEAAGEHTNAVACARQFGAQRLGDAVTAAQKLPSHTGALLLQLSDELRESFNPEE